MSPAHTSKSTSSRFRPSAGGNHTNTQDGFRRQTNCSTNTQNRYSDLVHAGRPDRVCSCRTCEREAQPSKQTVCRRHCRETPENRTIIARYHGPASHTLVNACAHETSFWTPMCVSHVTVAFTCLFIPNGPLMLQKTPHTMTYDALPEHYTWTQGLVCM